MGEDIFKPINSRTKNAKLWRCPYCKNSFQVMINNSCPTCKKRIDEDNLELINVRIKTFLCWDCQYIQIADINTNKENGNLRCPNCGSLNKIQKNKRNPLDSKLRHECFKRDRYKCLECGATNKEKTLHCDHIISVAQGGSDEMDNLQTLCDDCNLAKSDKSWKGNNKKIIGEKDD